MNYRRFFIPNSIIFATVVTYGRKNILIENIDILRKSFQETKQKYTFNIVAICIMKDHFHILFQPQNIHEYPDIIKRIKRNFSANIDIKSIQNYSNDLTRMKKSEKAIWQRRYYEHTILSEKDLNKHIDYIHFNSMKHYNIAPKDWKFSFFGQFVKNGLYEENWCNFEDINKISLLDYE